MSNDVVGIWAYRSPLIDKTVASLVTHTPENIPIYILDQAPPDMIKEKDRMKKVADKYNGRIEVSECFMSKERSDGPLSLIRFLEDHPEVDRLLKIDDDFIVPCDIYTGLSKAYDSKPDTLFSCGLCPIQIWGLEILWERLRWNSFFVLDNRLFNPELMYDLLKSYPDMAKTIWELTTPPQEIIPSLQIEPRFVEVPLFKRIFSMGHYFAHRKDILEVGGIGDEPGWNKMHKKTKRPRVMDTWSLVYHFAWFKWYDYAVENILPIIEKMEY